MALSGFGVRVGIAERFKKCFYLLKFLEEFEKDWSSFLKYLVEVVSMAAWCRLFASAVSGLLLRAGSALTLTRLSAGPAQAWILTRVPPPALLGVYSNQSSPILRVPLLWMSKAFHISSVTIGAQSFSRALSLLPTRPQAPGKVFTVHLRGCHCRLTGAPPGLVEEDRTPRGGEGGVCPLCVLPHSSELDEVKPNRRSKALVPFLRLRS